MKIKYLSIFVILAICLGVSSSYGFSYYIKDVGNNVIYVNNGKRIAKIKLKHENNGYKVNCDKSYLVVWGHDVPLNESNPQDSSLTLIKLDALSVVKINRYSKGIYGFKFLKNHKEGYVDTDYSQLLTLKSGNVTDMLNSDLSKLEYEECDNEYKKLN